jgi:hypothetical protein
MGCFPNQSGDAQLRVQKNVTWLCWLPAPLLAPVVAGMLTVSSILDGSGTVQKGLIGRVVACLHETG